MKKLHEKKISELKWEGCPVLIPGTGKTDLEQGLRKHISCDNLKQWAIAVVREIRRKREKSLKELEKIKCPKCGQPRPSSFCMVEDTDQYVENFLIDRFELTEEDLK